MSKISELDPITGANTRTEDLFVIVNLVQGDDGTKNITRKELVEAIQYEIFSRITITGGTIANVVMSNSTLNDVVINTSDFIAGEIDRSLFKRGTIDDSAIINSTANNVVMRNSTIDRTGITNSTFDNGALTDSTGDNLEIENSSFNDGTMETVSGNNVTLVNSTIDNSTISNTSANNMVIENSQFNNGTGNNVILTNSQIDDSLINRPTIEGGVANGTILTNVQIDGLTLEDVIISNSEIIDTNFSNGAISQASITNSTAESIIITDSQFNNGTGNNVTLVNSTIDNSLIQNSVIANTEFQGALEDVSILNATITSSFASNTGITESTFQGRIENSTIANSNIEDLDLDNVIIRNSKIIDSELVDFDMNIEKKFEPNLDEDSYFALKNEQTGEVEQFSYRQFVDELSKTVDKSTKIHVDVDGNDDYPGTMLQPVKTLERAAEIALEKAGGSYNRNGLNNGIHISVGPGTHYTKGNIKLPDDCAITSTGGQYCTVIQALPGYENNNAILVGSGCYAQGFSFFNWEVDNFDYPEGGFAYAYRPGTKILRSPYVRDSSQLSNFRRLDVEPPLQPFNSKGTIADLGREIFMEAGHSAETQWAEGDEVTFSSGAYGYISWATDVDSDSRIYVRNLKGNISVGDYIYTQTGGQGQIREIGIDDFPNPLVGRGGGVVLADRRVLDTDSLYTYFLCFGATPRTQNGIGYVARDGAGVNGIGSLSIFVRVAFYALNGGQMTLNNSGTQFGDISMRAKGSTTIFAPQDTSATLIGNSVFADVLENNAGDIIEDMVEYLTANTASGGLNYQAYDSDKCRRDTGIIVDSVGYDVALNSNYWGRLNGITYRSPISQVVYGEQLNETAGAIRHLKGEIDSIFANSNTAVIERANTSFNATLDILENGEPYAPTLTFADTGVVARTASRELLQANKEIIAEKLIDWIEDNDEFYAYDSGKCRRDIQEYILPAVKYDMLLDTNYNSVTAGGAYYMATASKVINQQKNETVSAYEHLRQQTDEILSANSSLGSARAYDGFTEVIDIIRNSGQKFTPLGADYNPVSGAFTITIGRHEISVGDKITLADESFVFTCGSDRHKTEIVHPRPKEYAYRRQLTVTAVSALSITVNVGASPETSTHKFVRALKDSVAVAGSALRFSSDAALGDGVNARVQLQNNKAFLQDYMMAYIDDTYFVYDGAKCKRDMSEYILPAVQRDMMLGTNFNAIQSGIAYRGATATEVVDSQLTETSGAVEFLRDQVNELIVDADAEARANTAFNEIVSIMRGNGRTYTPTNATYDPITGVMVLTLGAHDLQVGSTIKIAPGSITFECGSPAVEISHPRTTDPIYNKAVTIAETTSTTITLNVGDAGGYTGAHTFVSAESNCVTAEWTGAYTPQTATYDPVNGEMIVDIGTHNLQQGDWIEIEPESITFECGSPAEEISHPRTTDPIYRQAVRIHEVDGTTIKVYVGNAGGYTGAHTFVRAEANAINANGVYWSDPAKTIKSYTPTGAIYNPTTGVTELEIGTHNIQTGDHVEIMPYGVTFSCGSPVEYISNPRAGEPNYGVPVEITGTSATSITFNSGSSTYTGAHTFVSARPGAVVHTQTTRGGVHARQQLLANKQFVQDEVVAYLDNNYFTYDGEKCARDTGLILDAVKRDVLTGSNFSSVFAGLAYRSGNASTDLVVTDQLTETVGAITWLKGEIGTGLSGTALTRSDAAFDEIIDIMNNGQGNADALDFGTDTLGADETEARTVLQANKVFLQSEMTAWIAANYPDLTYDSAKCERDLGYIIDSVSFDIQHGGNSAAWGNARLYYDNAVSVLPADQRIPTVEAFEYIAEIASQIVRGITPTPTAGNPETVTTLPAAYTPTNADYDPITGIMTLTFGSAHNMSVGDRIMIADNGITFECGSPAVQISHPRSTDPISGDTVRIDAVPSSTTITVYVGDANGYTGAHTFISAVTDCVTKANLGIAERTRELMGLISTMIQENDFNELPAVVEPSSVTSGAVYEAFEQINGVREKYAFEILEFIREQYNGLPYNETKCRRDIGYIIDAIAEDVEYGGNDATITAAERYFEAALELSEAYPEKQTRPASLLDTNVDDTNYVDYIKKINTLPKDQREPTYQAYVHMANVVSSIVQEIAVTPTTGNSSTQDTSGTAANAATGTIVQNLVLDIANSIRDYSRPTDLPAIAGAPTYSPKRTFARQALQYNKKFLQDEVVAYINNKYFGFDEGKCARDAAFILDAVGRDMLTDGNYHSIYAGLAYRSGTVGSNIVINDQLAETVKAFEWLKKKAVEKVATGSKAAVGSKFDEVLNIMKDGNASYTFNFGNAQVSTSNANAAQGLQLNKAFLQAEVIAWLALNHGTLVYDQNKCRRDVGYMVDAISHDVRHDSNVATRDVARLYFENAVSVLPEDQRIPTAEVFEHIAAVAENLVLKNTVTKSVGNLENPVTTGFGNTTLAIAANLETLFLITPNMIRAEGLIDLPAEREAQYLTTGATGYTTEGILVSTQMNNIKPELQRDIVYYLNNNFPFLEYDESKCRRDTGYIVDAISHDIQYGGTAAITNCAGIYFENAINTLDRDQRTPTREAFTHLAETIEKIILHHTVTPTEGNTQTVDTRGLPGGNPAKMEIATEAKGLAMMIADIADDEDPSNIKAPVDPDITWVNSNYKVADQLIEDNTPTLVEDMITHITRTYNGLSFPRERCKRDMGLLVDAISHDVNYTTNHATRIAAQIYFENGISVLPSDTRDQTADVYEVMGSVLSDVVQEVDVAANVSFTIPSTQDFSGTAANATSGAYVADMMKVVEDVIRNDSLSAIPPLVEPITSWVNADIIWAADQIDDNLDELADDVTTWLNNNFTVLDYNKAKCRRDVGYLLDAFSFDLNYGGNAASRWNADFYFWNNIFRIPEDQRIPTGKSYRKLGEICSEFVLGKDPHQIITSGAVGTETEAQKVRDLGDIFYLSFYNNDTKYLPKLEQPDFDWDTNAIFKFSRDILQSKRTELQKEVVRFVNKEYGFVDINLTRRDALNLLSTIANDFRFINTAITSAPGYGGVEGKGSSKATRTYVASFFNYDGTHVFPVFNPVTRGLNFKGTTEDINSVVTTDLKPNDAYIQSTDYNGNRYDGTVYYWNGSTFVNDGANNTDLLYAFYKSWEKMRDYIITNYSPDADHTAMINGLFNDIVIANVLRPDTLVFGSLVESIAHQFNGASAGVNRTALPLNFRNIGLPISALASVLSEDGGRVRWSGADELNNQYFARGLRINGRTGRIEGRPFTSSVRKLARRASNSRAIV